MDLRKPHALVAQLRDALHGPKRPAAQVRELFNIGRDVPLARRRICADVQNGRRTIGEVSETELQFFLDRLRQRAPRDEEDDAWRRQDDEDAVLEVAKYVGSALKIPELERELVSRSKIDTKSLKDVRDWLESAGESTPDAFAMKFPDGTAFEWRTRIEKIDNMLESMPRPEELEEVEVGLRLNMIGDPAYERLLAALPARHEVRAKIVAKLAQKLTLLKDSEAFSYWSRLRNEVDASDDWALQHEPSVAPSSFFELGTPKDVRGRIAEYLARVRPLLMRAGYERGRTTVPAGNARIAAVLSWTETASTKAWSALDRTLIRSLGRVAFMYRGDKQELASALGVAVDGYFVGGRGEEEAKRALGKKKSPSAYRLETELLKLAKIAELRTRTMHAPLEKLLRSYRLGLEVMAPQIAREMRGRREELVQRELCRFLVERGIVAYGTKFGWSETDVRGEDELGTAIIETKRLKRLPSAADLNKWLTQLGSYMAQEQNPKALRGILVLYNFSSSSIFATRETLRSTYSVVAINLCPDPPSKRKNGIEIVPAASDTRIIDVLAVGALTPGKKATSAKKKTAGGRAARPR